MKKNYEQKKKRNEKPFKEVKKKTWGFHSYETTTVQCTSLP